VHIIFLSALTNLSVLWCCWLGATHWVLFQ